MKTVKMLFTSKQYYVTAANRIKDLHTPLYEAGKVYDIQENMVERWLKRGAQVYDVKAKVQPPAQVEKPKEEPVEDKEEKSEDEAKPESKQNSSKGK